MTVTSHFRMNFRGSLSLRDLSVSKSTSTRTSSVVAEGMPNVLKYAVHQTCLQTIFLSPVSWGIVRKVLKFRMTHATCETTTTEVPTKSGKIVNSMPQLSENYVVRRFPGTRHHIRYWKHRTLAILRTHLCLQLVQQQAFLLLNRFLVSWIFP